jgi:hypothetical protein
VLVGGLNRDQFVGEFFLSFGIWFNRDNPTDFNLFEGDTILNGPQRG